jgi:cytoskeleton protein RodZ
LFEIGSSLREARLRQGIDFVSAEQATKIRSKYLRALEDEQFAVLPAETYVRGFLRSYAEYLGLDGQIYVDEYNSRYVVDHEEPARPKRVSPRARQQRRLESRALVLALAGIVAVTGLVIVAWRYGGSDNGTVLPTVTVSAGTPGARNPTASARPVLLSIRALRGSSLLLVRAGSSTGRPLFSGTLERGDVQRFQKPKRLWVHIGAPGKVRVVVAGHTVLVARGKALTAVVTRKHRLVPVH